MKLKEEAGLSLLETCRGPKPALPALQPDVLHMAKVNQSAPFTPSLLYSSVSKHLHFPNFTRHSATIVSRSGFLPNSFNNIALSMLCVHMCKSVCACVCVHTQVWPKGLMRFLLCVHWNTFLLCSTAFGAFSANQLIYTSGLNPIILHSGWLRHWLTVMGRNIMLWLFFVLQNVRIYLWMWVCGYILFPISVVWS